MTDRILEIRLHDRTIGTVTQTAGGNHTFSYTPEHAELHDATPISLSMPLSSIVYSKKHVDPFLEGLLPDSAEVRQRWGDLFGVNGANPFALLEHMGADCAGAVEFHAPGRDVDGRSRALVPLGETDIGTRLAALRGDDAAWAVEGERWSLAGAQGKFALSQDASGRWCESTGAAPSTHIVKPGVVGYRDQALNEHICLVAARNLGLEAARSKFLVFDGEPALVVERYDRRRLSDGSLVRVHQEDTCQALSVYPRRKYEASGGPKAADIATLLWESGTDARRDVTRFIRALSYNYLIGAPDAHAKNYSLLLAGAQVRLAPLYDIASALPYDPSRTDHELDRAAMGIGGEKRFGEVTGRHWAKLAAGCRMPAEQVHDIVRDLAAHIPDALTAAFDDHRASALRERMLTRVSEHCANIVAKL